MSDKDLIKALRGMTMMSLPLACFGCGHEHSCSVHGCTIINEAVVRLESIAELPNDPLTLDELRKVSEDNPILVWVVCIGEDGTLDYDGEWQMFDGCYFVNDTAMDVLPNYGTKFVAYRRKPEAERT